MAQVVLLATAETTAAATRRTDLPQKQNSRAKKETKRKSPRYTLLMSMRIRNRTLNPNKRRRQMLMPLIPRKTTEERPHLLVNRRERLVIEEPFLSLELLRLGDSLSVRWRRSQANAKWTE